MKKIVFLPFLALLCGCVSTVPYDQISIFAPGENGAAGTFPAYRLRSYGNFGAGMLASGKADVIFDGMNYFQLAETHATHLTASELLSSGWAVRFRPDRVEVLPDGIAADAVAARVDTLVPDRRMACAWRIVGAFKSMTLATANGRKMVADNIDGMIFAIRAGRGSVNEMWFVSSNRANGGRVDTFTLASGSLAVDLCPRDLFINTGLKFSERKLK